MTEVLLRVVGVLIALGLVVLVLQAAAGRARLSSCCAAPPDRDLRLRDPSAARE